jgi:hypothetical protein
MLKTKMPTSPVILVVGAVLVVFTALKLTIMCYYGPFEAPDSGPYRLVADAIRHNPTFWNHVPDWTTAALPTVVFRPIGYPLLLASLNSDIATILCQIAISLAVSILLCRLIYEATASARLAGIAGAFYLGGYSLLIDNSVLSDSLYAGIFNVVVLAMMRAAYRRQAIAIYSAGLLGVAWGYSIWTRENGLFLTIIPLALLFDCWLVIPAAGRRWTVRLLFPVTFLAPVVVMVGMYVAWNAHRTGQAFLGITGAANYLRPVFDIAKAGYADPFDDSSALSTTVKATMKDFDFPEQLLLLQRLHDQTGVSPLALQTLALDKLIDTVLTHPLAYGRVVMRNIEPSSYGALLFDPIFTINDFFQLCIPPYQRVVPGSGLKSWKSLIATRNWPGMGLAGASAIATVGSTVAFLLVLFGLPTLALRRKLTPELALALKSLAIFVVVAIAFGLIHTEARHMLPVIPAALIAAAIAVAQFRGVAPRKTAAETSALASA